MRLMKIQSVGGESSTKIWFNGDVLKKGRVDLRHMSLPSVALDKKNSQCFRRIDYSPQANLAKTSSAGENTIQYLSCFRIGQILRLSPVCF